MWVVNHLHFASGRRSELSNQAHLSKGAAGYSASVPFLAFWQPPYPPFFVFLPLGRLSDTHAPFDYKQNML